MGSPNTIHSSNIQIQHYIKSLGKAYIYKLPGLVMFASGCCPTIDKVLKYMLCTAFEIIGGSQCFPTLKD